MLLCGERKCRRSERGAYCEFIDIFHDGLFKICEIITGNFSFDVFKTDSLLRGEGIL